MHKLHDLRRILLGQDPVVVSAGDEQRDIMHVRRAGWGHATATPEVGHVAYYPSLLPHHSLPHHTLLLPITTPSLLLPHHSLPHHSLLLPITTSATTPEVLHIYMYIHIYTTTTSEVV